MSDLVRLTPVLTLFTAAVMITSLRRARVALAGRRMRRAKAEAAEYKRMTGWVSKIRPDGAGPAISRDKEGNVVLFAGLRRYRRSTRRTRKSRKA